METLQRIKERRSVRRFQDKAVDREVMIQIVEAAAWAPSWKNTQTARYTVIDNREIIKDIAENGCLGFEFNKKTLMQAPVLVVVTFKTYISGYESDGCYSTSKGDRWQMFDAGVAAQTFSLAACEYGIGSVMMGIYDEEYIANLLKLDPAEEEVAVLIAAGYPKFTPNAPGRKGSDEILKFL